jgi:hypothetical protein
MQKVKESIARDARKPGPMKPIAPKLTRAEKALRKAMRERLLELAAADPTARSLYELGALAGAFRGVLASGKATRRTLGGFGEYTTSITTEDVELVDNEDGTVKPVFSTGQTAYKAETFGATLVRELIAAAKDFQKATAPKPSAIDAVTAIAIARQHKMPELADKLQAELLGRFSGGKAAALPEAKSGGNGKHEPVLVPSPLTQEIES